MLEINMDTLRLHLGFPAAPLTYDFHQISTYIEPTWLSTTWEFVSNIFVPHLNLANQWELPLDRQGDRHLMPQAVALHHTHPQKFPRHDLIDVVYTFRFYHCQI